MKAKWMMVLCLLAGVTSASAQDFILESPSSDLKAEVYVQGERVSIALFTDGQKLVETRTMQFKMDKPLIRGDWKVMNSRTETVRQSWQPLYGERKQVPDRYNRLTVEFVSETTRKEVALDVRLYDEGLAFRYDFDGLDFWNRVLEQENTQFLFDKDYTAWASNMAQSEVYETTLSGLKEVTDRPQVINADGTFLAIGEAALVDFARMKLKKEEDGFGLTSALGSKVNLHLAGYESPWRYVMVADSPGKLVENNYFVLNLNEPNQLKDTGWIKPGRVIREVTLTTQGGMACVDFAAANGLEYIEFDAGWYGHEYDMKSDATTVTVDPSRSKGPLDLQRVIDYANGKGVGVILYVNMKALSKQLDDILPLYQQWGVKGVKFGFVDVGDQLSTAWLHHAVRKAAKYKLMVDIHDEYRPTGYSRTYPNLITQEGIRGDEESPSVQQSVYTFYTRMICGAGDYTNCYYAERVASEKMGGLAAQFAKRVAIYSPWQFVYWYDRPQGAPGAVGGAGSVESFIRTDQYTDFYNAIPVVWDETRFLEGEMGAYTVVARRSGDDWYIAALNAGADRTVELNIAQLVKADGYTASWLYQPSEKKKDKVAFKAYRSLPESISLPVSRNSGWVFCLKKK